LDYSFFYFFFSLSYFLSQKEQALSHPSLPIATILPTENQQDRLFQQAALAQAHLLSGGGMQEETIIDPGVTSREIA
jgi:hypothetical protein